MTSPWRTTAEAAEYLRFVKADGVTPDLKRLHAWQKKYVGPQHKRLVGRSLRIHIDAIEPTRQNGAR